MQLEKLKKAELVKLARELKQELKAKKKEVDSVDPDKLPLIAQTYYRNGDDHVVEIFKYSPKNGQTVLVEKIVESNKELALYKLEMAIAERLMEQVYQEEASEWMLK